MKKIIRMILIAGCIAGGWPSLSWGQSWKDILQSSAVKEAVTAVTGGKKLSVENLQGTWTYVRPALRLEGDNTLKNIAAGVASAEAEKKMKEYCAKVGIVEGIFNYSFQADSTFTSALKKGSLQGTYSFDADRKTLSLHYALGKNRKLTLTTLTAEVVLTGSELTLLFNANKLLRFLSLVSSVSGSATLQAIQKLADQYEGMQLGFDLEK